MRAPSWGPILTYGLGTAVAMWLAGYLARLPLWPGFPAPVLFAWLLLCPLAGGFLAGRHGGLPSAFGAGLVTGCVNLLVLGGALTSGLAAYWVPASVLFTAVVAAAGGLVGQRRRRQAVPVSAWVGRLAKVQWTATLVLLASGGLVTGFEAGLAVPDWPNTYGYFMFAYPLARMTGGVYYEHAHRLYGSLVGLCTLVLAVVLWRTETRRGVRYLGLGLFVFVVVQGLLGGLRVTGRPTLAADPELLRPSTALAVVHGITAQLFLALATAMLCLTAPGWRTAPPPRLDAAAHTDRVLLRWLAGALLLQLLLGALQRHLGAMLHVHLAFAAVVASLAVAAGARPWARPGAPPLLRTFGKLLVAAVLVQVVLGVAAALVSGAFGGPRAAYRVEVPVTTAHQVTGALLLALTTALLLWTERLLTPESRRASPASPSPAPTPRP